MFEVKSVDANSAAFCCGIRPGDYIISINGEKLVDYIDYIYFCAQKKLKIKAARSGAIKMFRLKKAEGEDIGITFTESLIGNKRVCANKCIFCFVDQLPNHMRKSLYLKDEDWRYSLIMGNFLTLSSISCGELARIIKRKASPLYISVHTVDEELRKYMLGNPQAAPVKPILKKLAVNGIRFHAQAVVCPGINDGEKLEQTFRFLKKLYPAAISLAIVPVGLTGFRQGLPDIRPVTKAGAEDIIKRVENWQKECLNSINTRFVFAADELYLRASVGLPPAAEYEGFPQIENGVGLLSKFLDEAESALSKSCGSNRHISVAAGEDAFPFLKAIAEKAQNKGAAIEVYMVKNKTFGGGVTVSGLLAGADFFDALNGYDLGEALLISADALSSGVFLDDMKLSELEKNLKVKIIPVGDGYRFAELLCGEI